MKKYLALALCALTFASFGATLQTVNNLQPGAYEFSGSGKITSVDVFSAAATGTVKIDRVFKMEHFTNAVDTTTTFTTNVVDNPTYNVKMICDGIAYTNVGSQVESLREWYVSTNNVRDELYWSMAVNKWVYRHGDTSDSDFIGYSINGSSDLNVVDFGADQNNMVFQRVYEIAAHNWSTNVVTTVTTNSVTPVKAYDLTITNAVLNGTCSGGAYHGAPSDGVWLYPGDKLNFSGTAVGGTMRVVIE